MFAAIPDDAGTLHITDVPRPDPTPGEVEIAVHAAGINRADLLQRAGLYPPPPGASDILGLEVSGVITRSQSPTLPVGTPVCALLAGGGYAEFVCAPASSVLPVPDGVSLVEAAALPEVAATVLSNLLGQARLQPGETILIHGGAGGIGTHAIQFAKSMGCMVAVTAGSDDKLTLCRDLGADIAINYRDNDFAAELANQVDVILDVIGAKYLTANIAALAPGGRLVIIGMQGGTTAEVNIASLLTKRASVAATNVRGRPVDGPGSKAEIMDDVERITWPKIDAGDIKPVVSQVFPINEANQALAYLDSGNAWGKILLTTPAA